MISVSMLQGDEDAACRSQQQPPAQTRSEPAARARSELRRRSDVPEIDPISGTADTVGRSQQKVHPASRMTTSRDSERDEGNPTNVKTGLSTTTCDSTTTTRARAGDTQASNTRCEQQGCRPPSRNTCRNQHWLWLKRLRRVKVCDDAGSWTAAGSRSDGTASCAFFGMRVFVCLFVLCTVPEGWKEASPPFESVMATVGRMFFLCARGKETPILFLVRAFHLLVSSD